jgi:formate C-acetyltransferase
MKWSPWPNNLARVPWEPPRNFWEAMQALWLNHMLVMSDENYPGPGVSFGRFDQYLLPYWRASLDAGMTASSAKKSSSASGCIATRFTTR